jgi:hypothetical protein
MHNLSVLCISAQDFLVDPSYENLFSAFHRISMLHVSFLRIMLHVNIAYASKLTEIVILYLS